MNGAMETKKLPVNIPREEIHKVLEETKKMSVREEMRLKVRYTVSHSSTVSLLGTSSGSKYEERYSQEEYYDRSHSYERMISLLDILRSLSIDERKQ